MIVLATTLDISSVDIDFIFNYVCFSRNKTIKTMEILSLKNIELPSELFSIVRNSVTNVSSLLLLLLGRVQLTV